MAAVQPRKPTNDAEAIVVAAQRPEMRFVEPKKDQQATAVLFRARERLVHQRTDLISTIRSICYEYGHDVPIGIHQVKRIAAISDEPNCDLNGRPRQTATSR